MPTLVKVRKWGSSVLIPRPFAKMRHIDVGTVIDLQSVRLVGSRRRRCTLAQLVTKYKPRHRHGEWSLGDPVGKEVW